MRSSGKPTIEIGKAFLQLIWQRMRVRPGSAKAAAKRITLRRHSPRMIAKPRGRDSGPPRSGFFLLQNLPALVHAGLEVEVVGTAQLAGVLVLDISGLLQRIRRAAH